MVDFFVRLANTTVPGILSLLGGLLLLIAIGVETKVVLDVSQVSKLTAAVLSAICLGLAGTLWIARFMPTEAGKKQAQQSGDVLGGDPFLKYYVVSGVILVGLLFLIMAYSQGVSQPKWVGGLFVVTGLGISAIVYVRFVAVRSYMQAQQPSGPPIGLNHGHSNLFPYFFVLGAVTALVIWMILHYTQGAPNSANRDSLLWQFVGLCGYLVVCRVVWALIDYQVPPASMLNR